MILRVLLTILFTLCICSTPALAQDGDATRSEQSTRLKRDKSVTVTKAEFNKRHNAYRRSLIALHRKLAKARRAKSAKAVDHKSIERLAGQLKRDSAALRVTLRSPKQRRDLAAIEGEMDTLAGFGETLQLDFQSSLQRLQQSFQVLNSVKKVEHRANMASIGNMK